MIVSVWTDQRKPGGRDGIWFYFVRSTIVRFAWTDEPIRLEMAVISAWLNGGMVPEKNLVWRSLSHIEALRYTC